MAPILLREDIPCGSSAAGRFKGCCACCKICAAPREKGSSSKIASVAGDGAADAPGLMLLATMPFESTGRPQDGASAAEDVPLACHGARYRPGKLSKFMTVITARLISLPEGRPCRATTKILKAPWRDFWMCGWCLPPVATYGPDVTSTGMPVVGGAVAGSSRSGFVAL